MPNAFLSITDMRIDFGIFSSRLSSIPKGSEFGLGERSSRFLSFLCRIRFLNRFGCRKRIHVEEIGK